MRIHAISLISLIFTLILITGCGASDRSSYPTANQTSVTTQKPTSLSVSGQKSPGDANTTADGNTTSENNATGTQNSLSLTSSIQMKPGERLPLYLTVTYPDGHTESIHNALTFTSDDPAIASVDDQGVITAHKVGTTRIYVRYQDLTALLQVAVRAEAQPLPVSLQIVSYQTSAEPGQQIPLHARLLYDDNRSQDLESDVTWQSQTPEICTVSQSGIVTAEEAGLCLIDASYQSFETNTTIEINRPPEKVVYACTATLQSEQNFQDLFVTQNYPDINYSTQVVFENLTVTQIETMFNRARASDPTVNEMMVLPPQNVWDSYTASEKTLYLVNAERCARGIRPLEGIDDTLEKNVTEPYARYIAAHESAYLANPHNADGKTPGERMADAGIVLGTTSEYWGENIAMIGISLSTGTQPLFESEAKSVYGWLYMDEGEAYGHRETILQRGFDDNSGENGKEGLLAAATIQKEYRESDGSYWTKAFTVMDLFDPTAQWDQDLSHAHSVPLYRMAAP